MSQINPVNKLAPAAFFKSTFVVQLNKSNSTFTLPHKYFDSEKYSLIYTVFFMTPTVSLSI